MSDDLSLFGDDAPTVPEQPVPTDTPIADWQVDLLRKALDSRGLATMADRQQANEAAAGRAVESLRELTNTEAMQVLTRLGPAPASGQRKTSTWDDPDRSAIIASVSKRFGEILSDIQYPKLSNPMIADDLTPYVRNHPYTAASSGGVVLVSLAWNLAIWEVAHEAGADAPGLLVIDSPQKNLGHDSKDDADFADTTLVENFYRHVKTWLAGDGAGAQLIVVDNSPPDLVAEDVVVRFTRSSTVPPYGLIPEATG